MRISRQIKFVLLAVGTLSSCYIAGYCHYVHPMPIRVGDSDSESVEPVFRTARHGIIRLFGPAVAVDQAVFPGRWEPKRFQLIPTDLAGLCRMSPFLARVEGVGRTMPHNTGVTTLHLRLRFDTGHLLQVNEPGATEPMFATAGALMDTQLHEFPTSWFDTKIAK